MNSPSTTAESLKISTGSSTGQRIGLLAGGGRFPIAFAQGARRQGHRVYCVGVQGMASEELRGVCDCFVTSGLGKIGRAIRLFKAAGIDRVVMAGKIEKIEGAPDR